MTDRMAEQSIRRLRRIGTEEKFLGPLEAVVMERLWKRGTATVREIVEDLGRTRALAYTTVMTIMTRLHEKGLLERARDGKTYVYRPAVSRQEHRERLSRELVRGLVDEFGEVALAQFAEELGGVDGAHRAALKRIAKGDGRAPR
jgi:predicted transcriptional regulator